MWWVDEVSVTVAEEACCRGIWVLQCAAAAVPCLPLAKAAVARTISASWRLLQTQPRASLSDTILKWQLTVHVHSTIPACHSFSFFCQISNRLICNKTTNQLGIKNQINLAYHIIDILLVLLCRSMNKKEKCINYIHLQGAKYWNKNVENSKALTIVKENGIKTESTQINL